MVLVDGRVVVDDHRLVAVDAAALVDDAQVAASDVWRRFVAKYGGSWRADMSRECWSVEAETLAPAAMRAIQEERLARQLEYTWRASAFYREKWQAAGVDPRRVRRLEELARLPFTEKRELQDSQEAHPPFGANQCAPLDQAVRMQATGGTTGRPLRMIMTRHDVGVYNELGARGAWAAGMRPGDLLFECMNYSLYAGGVSDHHSFEHLGACVAPVGIGQSRRLIEILRDVRMETCLWSTPSYALHLANVARDGGVDPVSLGLRKGFFSGDAGLAIPGYRREIEAALGLVASDIYGLGELGGFGAECRHRGGLHFLGADVVVAELIDPTTGDVLPVTEGRTGELVYTTIDRECHPLIRFRSHDHVRVFAEPCPCGRSGFRFEVLGRSDDMFIVKGINVFPLGVQDVVLGFRPALTGEFQILLPGAPPITYDPALRVEASVGVAPAEFDALRDRLSRRIRDVLVFTPEVTVLPFGSLPQTERKAKRLYRLYLGETP
jgi:phenylacetate-CoA ligase